MTIIDARLRPPLKDYLRCNLYRDPKKTQGWSNNFLMKVSPAVEQRDADLLYREMDDAGVTLGVMTGRQSPDMGNVSNDDLMDVVREQPSRFVGIAGVDGSDPIAAIAEIERTVANGNLRGAGMEPGCGAIPMYVDDARLYPIYQYCSDRSIPMFLMGGGGNGPDLSYSNPEHIDRVCRDFPKLAVVNMPWVIPVGPSGPVQLHVPSQHVPRPRYVHVQHARRGGLRDRGERLPAGPVPVWQRLPLHPAEAGRGSVRRHALRQEHPAEPAVQKHGPRPQA